MTKKYFKELCSFHVYGRGQNRHNAIYFGWQSNEQGRGFKAAVACDTSCRKDTLFHIFYDWFVNGIEPPYFVRYKYAEDDSQRFKVPIALNF